MADLFEDEPKPNSPEDLGGTFTPRSQRPARRPKPWDTEHPDHPSNRPENRILTGEDPPESWNVSKGSLGIQHMRTFLEWCEGKDMDTTGHSVGTLYCALNAHGLGSFRWLCTALGRGKFTKLPPVAMLDKAIKKRDVSLLYSDAT